MENGRRKIEEFYKKRGYAKVRVTIAEGNKPGDLRVIYLIDEGPRQRVFWVNFVGNTFVSAARLKKMVNSHPPYFYLFTGEYDPKQVNEDVNKLTAYYRGFGYFHAVIGREVQPSEEQNWVTITFVINEGPRYSIRDISFLGNRKFENTRLADKLKLLSGQFFDQNQQNLDLQKLRDEYGGEGYVFAKVEADNRFLEEPGKLDIVYTIEEGDRYRVGRINIEIKGESPHTMITTVLNRLSIKPGDIADTREIRASERRLKAAQLFKVEPQKGVEPKIAYSPPDTDNTMIAGAAARRLTTAAGATCRCRRWGRTKVSGRGRQWRRRRFAASFLQTASPPPTTRQTWRPIRITPQPYQGQPYRIQYRECQPQPNDGQVQPGGNLSRTIRPIEPDRQYSQAAS